MAAGVDWERKMLGFLKCFVENEGGATAIEYALIASFLSLALVSGAQAVGMDLVNIFGNASSAL
jgi:pilus assembly protein Flp/PilA